ncbi:MAG: 50S ribosomal protein L13 [bacterium]|nr:50S ribosomal protein L13 [bacterium]
MGLTKSYTKESSPRNWYLIDLKDQVLGRAASKIAMILRGKDKASFTPHEDVGDFVVAINAKDIHLSGNKRQDKMYYHYTGYIGGLKEYNAERLLNSKPEELIRRAVRGMLPKNILGRHQLKKLKIYSGSEHPHSAQKPQPLNLTDKK